MVKSSKLSRLVQASFLCPINSSYAEASLYAIETLPTNTGFLEGTSSVVDVLRPLQFIPEIINGARQSSEIDFSRPNSEDDFTLEGQSLPQFGRKSPCPHHATSRLSSGSVLSPEMRVRHFQDSDDSPHCTCACVLSSPLLGKWRHSGINECAVTEGRKGEG